MRHLVLFVIGIALGAIGAAIVVNALARRDAYARGVMEVMQHHYGELRRALRAGKCANGTDRDKAMLGELVAEIEPAYAPDPTTAAPFREYTERLRNAVAALPAAPASCEQLAPIVTKIGNACDECHRQYR